MTKEYEFMSYLLIGLALVLIFVFLTEDLLAAEPPQEVVKRLTPPLLLQLLNEADASGFGPVAIKPPIQLGNSFIYEITVRPELKLLGVRASDTKIISILRFKGHSVRAKVVDSGGERDAFTIGPKEDVITEELKGTVTSDVRLVEEYKIYSDILKEGTPILIRNSDQGAVLVSVFVNRKDYPYVPEIVEKRLIECEIVFKLECKTRTAFTTPLYGCSPGGKLSDCEQSVELCSGTARVKIFNTRDELRQQCVDTVRTDITYEKGDEWKEAGETVFISFWKDTDCTRETSEFGRLLAECREDLVCPDDDTLCKDKKINNVILGGEFELNAGIITPR